MNILFLIGKYPGYGGTETITTILANAFQENQHDVSIVSFEQPVPELKKHLNPDIELLKLSYPTYSKKNILKLQSIINNKKIDFIINQWCLPFYVTRLCIKAISNSKCRLISVLHGLPDKNKRLLFVQQKIKTTRNFVLKHIYKLSYWVVLKATSLNLKYVYNRSYKYVLLSESFIPTFKRLTKIDEKKSGKLISIENPLTIDNKKFKYDPDKKEKIILYIGRMDYINKRVHRIVEAWGKIYKLYPEWKLMLVGDGPEKSTLIEYVDVNNIKNTEFKAFSSEPPTDYYKKASILMLTSDLEGFGLVIVEGMSFGVVPVVYGSYQAVYDIIENNKSGYITSPSYNEEKTILCLKKLMDDENNIESFAKRSILISKKFDLKNIVNKWEEFLLQ